MSTATATDPIQQRIASYAFELVYEKLTPAVVNAAKVRLIDTLGALIAGFAANPCVIARKLAAQSSVSHGATVIGTRIKTLPDLAAFANATAARQAELSDVYHNPGSYVGHPSDMVMPVLAAAEFAQASGRELITAIVLAYEICLRLSDEFDNEGFDATSLGCIAIAAAAAKLLKLAQRQIADCIAIAAVSGNILRQVRTGHLTMWKALAAGQAGRDGVFAALAVQAGMEGPHLPFTGSSGWCRHIAGKPLLLDTPWGGGSVPFRILHTQIKERPSRATTMSCIFAAEKLAPIADVDAIGEIVVEVYKRVLDAAATGTHNWQPDTRETADHSAPYVVAATLLDGTITLRSFDDVHLADPRLRSLMAKMKVVENTEFTRAYEKAPVQHRTRITLITRDGKRRVAEVGGDRDDLSAEKSDSQIAKKFAGLVEPSLGAIRSQAILARLWALESDAAITDIPVLFAME